MIPLALNLFTAVCAALSLALLARSVALLPHDRSHDQRLKEHSEFSLLSIPAAWVPPVLAALVCGLQLSFWENATAASADMFDLLIFAYVVRCLLEYRINDRESWLLRASLAFGLGMTNNWAMIGFFPAFLVALVWIKGLSFFNLRFLARMFLCGSGRSVALLRPAVGGQLRRHRASAVLVRAQAQPDQSETCPPELPRVLQPEPARGVVAGVAFAGAALQH